ncbi:hypothetical protein EMCRGX_G009193 [Ephydatia muelleri]
MKDRIASNRQKLSSIIKTIVLCGRQNIALRGHCDNATDIENEPLDTENHGNFRALLNFSVDAGDTVLGEHLKAAAKNATCTSPVIQNQIIDVLEDQIRSETIRRVQKANWFTVIADEVTDVSNKEQLSLVLSCAVTWQLPLLCSAEYAISRRKCTTLSQIQRIKSAQTKIQKQDLRKLHGITDVLLHLPMNLHRTIQVSSAGDNG